MKSAEFFTPGSPKRKREADKDWYRKAWNKAFTQDEVIAKIRSLDNKDFLNMMNSLQPKVVESKGDTGITVVFNLKGVREERVIEAHMDQLPKHEDDEP